MAKITGSRNRYKRKRSKNPTSSQNRPSRSRASSNSSKVTTAGEKSGGRGQSRVTTERDTRRRKARSTVTGGQRAKVKIKPKSTGIIGTRNTPGTKTSYSSPKTPGVKFNPSKRTTPKGKGGKGGGSIKATLTAGLAGALSSGKLRNPVSKAKKREAAKSIGKYLPVIKTVPCVIVKRLDLKRLVLVKSVLKLKTLTKHLQQLVKLVNLRLPGKVKSTTLK